MLSFAYPEMEFIAMINFSEPKMYYLINLSTREQIKKDERKTLPHSSPTHYHSLWLYFSAAHDAWILKNLSAGGQNTYYANADVIFLLFY